MPRIYLDLGALKFSGEASVLPSQLAQIESAERLISGIGQRLLQSNGNRAKLAYSPAVIAEMETARKSFSEVSVHSVLLWWPVVVRL